MQSSPSEMLRFPGAGLLVWLVAVHMPARLLLLHWTPHGMRLGQRLCGTLAGVAVDLQVSLGVAAVIVACFGALQMMPPRVSRRGAPLACATANVLLAALGSLLMVNAAKVAYTEQALVLYDASYLREAPIALDSFRAVLATSQGLALALTVAAVGGAMAWVNARVVRRAWEHSSLGRGATLVMSLAAVLILIVGLGLIRAEAGVSLRSPAQSHPLVSLARDSTDLLARDSRPPLQGIAELRSHIRRVGGEPLLFARPTLNRRNTRSGPNRPATLSRGANVVLLLLEGFGEAALAEHTDVAPFWDRLSASGVRLADHYTTASRTTGAQLATLCSLFDPPWYYVIREYPAVQLRCLPPILGDFGYATVAVTAPPGWFDSSREWLTSAGFERVINGDDFPPSAPRFSHGVHDEALFDRLLEELDRAPKPVFAYGLTVSNHHPYEPPDGFSARHPETSSWDRIQRAYRYADEQLERFFTRAAGRPWFSDTLFVITGDHLAWTYYYRWGERKEEPALLRLRYRVATALVHPALTSRSLRSMTSHIDLAPTVLGLLGLEAETDFLGRDVFSDDPSPDFVLSQDHMRGSFYLLHNASVVLRREVAEDLCTVLRAGSTRPAACSSDQWAVVRRFEETFYEPVRWELAHLKFGKGAPWP